MEFTVARVNILDLPAHIDRPFDYHIPAELRGDLSVGSFVCVPFGGGNKKQLALIGELDCVSETEHLKPVDSVACAGITLSKEQLGLVAYMRQQTFCSTGDAVNTILPPSALTKLREFYVPTDLTPPLNKKLTEKQEYALSYVRSFGKVSLKDATRTLGEGTDDVFRSLISLGLIEKIGEFTDSMKPKTFETVSLSLSPEDAIALANSLRAPRQAELLRLLAEEGPKSTAELRDEYGFAIGQIRALEDKNAVKTEKKVLFRDPYNSDPPDEKYKKPPVLSAGQQKAKDEICSFLQDGQAAAVLLRGITGSGKTMVIKAVMDEVIRSGRSVIMLVPEISLTPQTVAVFRSTYGDRAVVIHSQLSAGERFDAWKRIAEGQVDLCIGTRSAVFAPFRNLGMIVIDEEQEHTYKSDMSPKYNARDIARFRCAEHKALMLLASATPSLESEYRALEGRYHEVILDSRFGSAVLPEGIIADLREDTGAGRLSPIGTKLLEALTETLSKGEQAILFVNRRGYNSFLSCPICGNVIMCPHCSVSYTYHRHTHSHAGSDGYLYCHYCGTKEPVPEKCPSCGSELLKFNGFGTQKVEEELHTMFPDARILRMDADTTSQKFAYDNILSAFRNREADILIGTQMVTKGHDFPGVTLVGVLSADSSLYVDDYRASERTFSLITQVIGRAGRGDHPGKALIQTYNPDHPVLQLAAKQDYMGFYDSEIRLRRSLVFPPCCDVLLLSLISEDEANLNTAAEVLRIMIDKMLAGSFEDVKMIVFGPIEAPLYKINENYKKNFFIKCRMTARTRELVRELSSDFQRKIGKKVTLAIDVNPNNI